MRELIGNKRVLRLNTKRTLTPSSQGSNPCSAAEGTEKSVPFFMLESIDFTRVLGILENDLLPIEYYQPISLLI